MGQISEIRPVVGAVLVGPLQFRTVCTAAVAVHAARPEAAHGTITYLRSPEMASAFATAGFDPPADGAAHP